MKKILLLAVSFLLIFTLSACSPKGETILGSKEEVFSTSLFDWTINSYYLTYDVEGNTPKKDYVFFVTHITTTNTSDETLTLESSEFLITYDKDKYNALETKVDGLYPDTAKLEQGQTIEGFLIFELPEEFAVPDVNTNVTYVDTFRFDYKDKSTNDTYRHIINNGILKFEDSYTLEY